MFGRTRVVGICLIFLVGALLAQYSAARLQGTVKDASGAVIPGAKITVQMIATEATLRTESNGAGLYVFPALQPGKYRLTVEAPSMEKWQGDLELMSGQEAVFDPALKVAGTATTITVAGDVTPLLITTSPTLSNVMERERIEQLPRDGRNVANLLLVMVPGMESGPSSAVRPSPFGLRDGIVQVR